MKQVNKSLLALLLVLSSCFVFGQNNTWTRMPDLSETLYSPANFTVGDNFYVVCGMAVSYGVTGYPAVISHDVWAFNTVTSTWSQKASYPGTPVYGGRGFTVGNYGYIVNGWDSSGSGTGPTSLWQYDPANDVWTQKADFPASVRYTTATFTLNGKGYLACGFSPYTNEVYSYDPTTDSWSQKNNFPGSPRQGLTSLTIGNYAYLGLGATSDGMGSYFLESDWYKYDATADVWTRLNDFPGNGLSSTFNFTIGNDGYVVDGLNQNSVYYSTSVSADNKMWKYTPATDTWSFWGICPDSAKFEGAYASCNGAGYMGSGSHNYSSYPLSRTYYRFGPSTAPYSCNIALNQFQVSNAVYNFQANGSFSPTAVITWNYGDGHTGTGTSVIHNYGAIGTYTVTVSISDTADNCTNSATSTVTVSNVNSCSVSLYSTSYGNVFTLASIVTDGAGPYTYQWSSTTDSTFTSTSPDPAVNVSVNSPATYCLTVTDTSGCIATACRTVVDSQTYFSPCQIYLVVYPDSTIPGAYYGVIYTSGAANLTYLWDFGDGTTSNLPFPSHTYATPGRYTVCLTVSDGAGCTFSFCDSSFYAYKYGGGPMQQFNVTKQLVLGINNIPAANIVSVYPNPATNEIMIDADGQKIDKATIYNEEGQMVSSALSPSQNKMNVSGLASGIYFVEVKVKDASTRVKFVKAN